MAVHVIPLNDLKEHTTDAECACSPLVEWIDPETNLPWANGSCKVVHNAFDKREVVEERIHRSMIPGVTQWTVVET